MSSGMVYYASTALDELARAQAELDAHIGSEGGGRCPACQEEVPCAAREAATKTFARYGWLPRRRPGLARVRPVEAGWREAIVIAFGRSDLFACWQGSRQVGLPQR